MATKRIRTIKNNCTGGILSELARYRIDIKQFFSSLQEATNMFTLPQGGTSRRPPTEYICTAKTADTPRMIPFVYSSQQAYILELSELAMRFVRDGAQIMDGLNPYEIVTPWAEEHLEYIRHAQINDVMWLACRPRSVEGYPLQKLSRVSDTSWTIEDFDFYVPPFLPAELDGTTLTPGDRTGTGIALVASADVFNADHVGAAFRLNYTNSWGMVEITAVADAQNATCDIIRPCGSEALTDPGFSDGISDWEEVVSGDAAVSWDGTNNELELTDNDGASTAMARAKINNIEGGIADGTVTTVRVTVVTGPVNLRVGWRTNTDGYLSKTALAAGTHEYSFTTTHNFSEGYAELWVELERINSAGTSEVSYMSVTQDASLATDDWQEGAFSDYQGWPAAVGLYQERLVLGSTYRQPHKFWCSKSGVFDDFGMSDPIVGSDAIALTLATGRSERMQWIAQHRRLMLGTEGGEIQVGHDDALTPTTPPLILESSNHGSNNIAPVKVGHTLYFCQRDGHEIRELDYDYSVDSYRAVACTALAEHLFREYGIVAMTWQQYPNGKIFAIRSDGACLVNTLRPEHDIKWAWDYWETEGMYLDVVTIPGSDGRDEVYFLVRRNAATT